MVTDFNTRFYLWDNLCVCVCVLYVFAYVIHTYVLMCMYMCVSIHKHTHACTCCIKVNFTIGRQISCFCILVSNITALYRQLFKYLHHQGPRILPLNIRTCNYSCNHMLMTSSINDIINNCDQAWENRSQLHVKFDLILRV